VAEYLWSRPKHLEQLARRYPRVATKRRLLKAWYDRLIAEAVARRRGR